MMTPKRESSLRAFAKVNPVVCADMAFPGIVGELLGEIDSLREFIAKYTDDKSEWDSDADADLYYKLWREYVESFKNKKNNARTKDHPNPTGKPRGI